MTYWLGSVIFLSMFFISCCSLEVFDVCIELSSFSKGNFVLNWLEVVGRIGL